MERTRVLLPDQAILPSWAPRCRTAIVPVALLRPDPVRGRPLAVRSSRDGSGAIGADIRQYDRLLDFGGLKQGARNGLGEHSLLMVSQSNSFVWRLLTLRVENSQAVLFHTL